MFLTRVRMASVLLLLLATLPLVAVAQLSGTYTIGGSSPSYATFGAAVNALNTSGVSGPVIFNVRAGTYNEHIRLAPVVNASATNTITFQSESGNAASVTLTYAASAADSNYVVLFDGGDNYRIQNMTVTSGGLNSSYRRVFVFRGVVSDVVIQGNVITGFPTSIGSNAALALVHQQSTGQNIDVRFLRNTMTAGSYGFYMEGNSSAYSSGTVIRGNTMNNPSGYGAMYMVYSIGPIIDSNTITSPNDAIYLNTCRSVSASEQILVTRNKIVTTAGGAGIILNNCDGNVLYSSLIANNFISITGSSYNYGLYMTGSSYVNVYHNSVNVTVPSVNGIALYVPGGNNIKVANNNFVNSGGGWVYYINTPSAITSSDRNNLFGNGTYLAYYSTTYITDLTTLQTASGWETNSFSANPVFTSATDLHANSPWLDGAGAVLAEVTTDIDNQARSGSAPDIGADEFSSSLTKMAAGSYTIGGTSPSYATVVAAVADLNTRGILGAVTFNIRPGTYDGQVSIGRFGGSSPSNTVTFQSESGNPAGTTIRFSQTDVTGNYVVRLDAASNLRFNRLTLISFGLNATYRTVVNFKGYVSNVAFSGDSLVGTTTTSGTSNLAVVTGYNTVLENVTFDGNRIIAGSYAVYLDGVSQVYSKGFVFNRNVVNNSAGYNGIYLSYHIGPILDSNTVLTRNDAIYLLYCSNVAGAEQVTITRNRIVTNAGGFGIFLNSCSANILYSALVANNFITITGASYNYGLYFSACSYLKVYHNSVNVNVPSTNGIVLYVPNGNNIQVFNNNFVNTGGGYVYYINTPSAITLSDRNNLFSNGIHLAYYSTTYIGDLPALQTASGWEANSVSANPNFVSATDLHATSPWLDGTGNPLAEVTVDIDGEPRSATAPDIGADEFTSPLTKMAGGTYTVGGSSPSYPTVVAAVADLNSRGILGPVTFRIRPGTYDGQVSIGTVGGASPTNTVTFESESGTSNGTALRFTQTDVTGNYVVRLDGASHIRFNNLTLISFGLNTTYRTVVNFRGYISNVSLTGDSLIGTTSTSSSSNLSLIVGVNTIFDRVTFDNNRLIAGSYGFYLDGVSQVYSKNTTIRRNIIANSGGYAGIYMTYQIGPVIDNNAIVSRNDAIYLLYCSNTLGEDQVEVTNNSLVTVAGGSGLFLNSCSGNSLYQMLIANNFVAITGTSYNYGLYLSGCGYANVFNNSVSVTVPSVNGIAMYVPNGNNLKVVNNLFVNTGNGYAYYCNTPSAFTWMNYNNLYTTGTNLAYWGNQNVSTLAELQTLSQKDSNSVSRPVTFVSSADLHLTSASIGDRGLTGIPLTEVPFDIDGEARNPLHPYMGADEGGIPLAVGDDGKGGITTRGGIEAAPLEYQLFQNYPNPFNPETVIKFSVRETGRARVDVYNSVGQRVATVFDGTADAGQYYQVKLSGIGLPSGMYFYRLQSGSWTDQKKMLLLK